MEQRGTRVAPLADVDDLRELASRPGPFVTSYLSFRPATEQLAREVEVRWQAQRRSLEASGAEPEALAPVEAALGDAHEGGSAGLAVVVPGRGAPLVERLAAPPPEGATFGRVPALRPLIDLRQRHPAHVVVLVDRTGADMRIRRRGEAVRPDVHGTVTGEDEPVRKVKPGGWSQRRYQQRAEDSWLHNMSQVADEVARLAADVEARLVAVGGDERAVGLLVDALPVDLRPRLHRIAVTRAADGSSERLDDEVAAEIDGWVAAQVSAVLDLHAEEAGQGDRAVGGAAGTLEALRSARVAMLVVTGGVPTGEERQVWVGASADQVATTPGDLASPDDVVAAPLPDAAVAAALATGADVLVVPADPTGGGPPTLPDGVGGLLRW